MRFTNIDYWDMLVRRVFSRSDAVNRQVEETLGAPVGEFDHSGEVAAPASKENKNGPR